MRLLRHFISSVALAGALTSGVSNANAQAPAPAQMAPASAAAFTDVQRQAIEAIIKDYLVKNPDVLQEAIAEGERRQQETQKLAQAAALKESREALVNSPHGVVVGNPSGDVTLVEFFDYNCGYCRKALADIQTLVEGGSQASGRAEGFPRPRSGITGSQQDLAGGQAAAQGREAVRVPRQASGEQGAGQRRAARLRWPRIWASTSPSCRRMHRERK